MYSEIDSQLGMVNVFRNDEVNIIEGTPVDIGGEALRVGDKTSLNGFFAREIEYLGQHEGYMQFAIGTFQDLLGTIIFANSFKKITETQMLTVYQAGTARDYHFKNGKWK